MQPQVARKRAETLEYIHSMLEQLRNMAEAEDCDMLGYLIEMAYLEANDILRGERPSRIAGKKRNASP